MKVVLLFIAVLFFIESNAQPHLSGTVKLKQKDGLIDCDFTLSNIPPLTDYRILLNHGMNIRYFLDDSNRLVSHIGWYGGTMKGEALEYMLSNNGDDTLRPLPSSFRIRYLGAYPVYGDTLNLFDFKGLMAANQQTFRATEQSKWYPVLYDVKNDRLIDNYTYDITVDAPDTKTVFINGSIPSQNKHSTFTSKIPRALFLFAGNYDFVSSNGNYILNASIEKKEADKIFLELQRIKNFLSSKLSLPYSENIFIISHKAVKPYPKGASWGFAVFPSFAYANMDFKTLVDAKGKFKPDDVAYFAHELSHFYFGDKMLSGALQWFWLESTTEYLSLKAAQALTDTAYYKKVIGNYRNFLGQQKYKPLAAIVKYAEIDDNYRYVYGPLIWLAFEKEFGQKATYQVLSSLIKQAATETLTLQSWKNVALSHGISEQSFQSFYDQYLSGPDALMNVMKITAPSSN